MVKMMRLLFRLELSLAKIALFNSNSISFFLFNVVFIGVNV